VADANSGFGERRRTRELPPRWLTLAAIACIAGWWAMRSLPVDAIPDLSETQVIILSRWDKTPDLIEDQVTYPIVTAMLGAPHVKTVRGFSDFGYSYVYVIFEDGTDLYWARSRVTEYLSSAVSRLPDGVKTELGPDATSLGWIFQYALQDTSGKHTLAEMRSYQDWYLRYYLRSVPGVAEVAPIGGYARQYQVNIDPNRLRAYGIPVRRVAEAVRGVAWSDPRVPVASNSRGAIVRDAESLQEALVEQIASPVRWVECVHALVAEGATTFLESGPGRVLGGLVRQIHPDADVFSADSPARLDEFASR